MKKDDITIILVGVLIIASIAFASWLWDKIKGDIWFEGYKCGLKAKIAEGR